LDFGGPSEQAFLLSRTKRPFTPSQWMELEHQALIYKYLNAKAPIPSSLLISISKSFRSSNRGMHAYSESEKVSFSTSKLLALTINKWMPLQCYMVNKTAGNSVVTETTNH